MRVVHPTRVLLLTLLFGYLSAGSASLSSSPSPEPVPVPDPKEVAPQQPAVYAEVNVAPTRTSIYIGTVSLTMPTFQRDGVAFRSSYVCKVFPYFFYNEKGTLFIDVPDAALARLAAGETITFSGKAMNTHGEPRRIEGRAVPASSTDGKIKVRVFVTPKIELIFNTTYFFPKTPETSVP